MVFHYSNRETINKLSAKREQVAKEILQIIANTIYMNTYQSKAQHAKPQVTSPKNSHKIVFNILRT